jgi:diguanylate cyclase (GGDEF)-like protein/PAS domain S-box-containing protein
MSQTVLLIQDHVSGARSVREALLGSGDESLRIEWVTCCSKALERLDRRGQTRDSIAAILVDLFLPDSQGIDTFERLFSAAPDTPILVLSALQDEDTAKLAVRRGAQDYLLKNNIGSENLLVALRGSVGSTASAQLPLEDEERARKTLDSIGDGVITTDTLGHVIYLNAVAEDLTGWSSKDARGRLLDEVFHVIEGDSREAARDPMTLAVHQNRTVSLAPNCILVRRDGADVAIEDSAAPILDSRGSVTGAVMVFRDVTAARAHSLEMTRLAQHDGLTGLPNKLLLLDRLTQAVAMADRHGENVTVLYLDIDRFKHVNDTAGHAIGDQLLQSIAKRLIDCVRGSDTVSRLGGDEFAVLLCDVAHKQDVAMTAKKILAALSKPHLIDNIELHVSASIGIATYPGDGSTAEQLLNNADTAMYRAKDSGRNNCKFFSAAMQDTTLPSYLDFRQTADT